MPKISSTGTGSGPIKQEPGRKKRRIGKTSRRRVSKKKMATAMPRTDRFYRRGSNYSRVEVLSSPSQKIRHNPDSWLKLQLEGDVDSPPVVIPEFIARADEQTIQKMLPPLRDNPDFNEKKFKSSRQYEEYHKQLDKLKAELGGSPNYKDKKPHLKLQKVFLGFTVERVKAWVNKALKFDWFPKPLWRALWSHLKMKTPQTHYEYLSLALQSLDRLKQNLAEIQARLQTDREACNYFNQVTGLTFHTRLNNPRLLASSVESYIQLFEHHFDQAVTSGNLKSFVEQAMPDADICFEARMRSMMAYNAEHPMDNSQGSELRLDQITDYDSQSPVEQALNEELRVLLLTGEQREFSAAEIRDHLINNKKLLGKKFTGGVCDSAAFAEFMQEEMEAKEVEVTEELLDKYLDFSENVVCLF